MIGQRRKRLAIDHQVIEVQHAIAGVRTAGHFEAHELRAITQQSNLFGGEPSMHQVPFAPPHVVEIDHDTLSGCVLEDRIQIDGRSGWVGDPGPVVAIHPHIDAVEGGLEWDWLRRLQRNARRRPDRSVDQFANSHAPKLLFPRRGPFGHCLVSGHGPIRHVFEIEHGGTHVGHATGPVHLVRPDSDRLSLRDP